MTTIELEFHPGLPGDLVKVDSTIRANEKKYEKPFFFEPRKWFNKDEIVQACMPFMDDSLEHVIILGTGGSIQTMLALQPFASRNVHPITSSRPSELKKLFSIPDLRKKSLVVPISRGGKTLDVNSLLYLFPRYKMLGLSSRGPMNQILKTMEVPMLDVPDLSGRFAASCTNVALVPAYLAGIDIEAFIDGQVAGYSQYGPEIGIQTNEAKQFAWYLYKLFHNGFRNVFSMPYSAWVEGAVGLWIQEISESTGKDGRGMLGTGQSAPLCQHSVLELLLGGSKFHTVPLLWTVLHDPHDMPLNSTFSHLQGKTAAETVLYQAHATFEALLKKGVPAAMITLEEPTPWTMGYLIAFIQSTVYYLCMLFDVNWADNPNVLIGKEICNEALAAGTSWTELKERRAGVAQDTFKDFWVL